MTEKIRFLEWPSPLSHITSTFDAAAFITGAQPEAGTGHKMQSVPVVFSGCIVRDISLTYLWECSPAHWNLIRHFEKREAAFVGTTFTVH